MHIVSWWRHLMETFSALLAICARNSPVPGEFPAQRPVTRSFDVSFDLRLNIWLSKQSCGWWFETRSRPLWRHRNVNIYLIHLYNISGRIKYVGLRHFLDHIESSRYICTGQTAWHIEAPWKSNISNPTYSVYLAAEMSNWQFHLKCKRHTCTLVLQIYTYRLSG